MVWRLITNISNHWYLTIDTYTEKNNEAKSTLYASLRMDFQALLAVAWSTTTQAVSSLYLSKIYFLELIKSVINILEAV